ncbi:MAG: hypothetical protein AAGF12_23845 [Myxococcota bacterium]
MSEDILRALLARLDEDIDGIRLVDDSLEAIVDARYGELAIRVDHDLTVDSLRVSVLIPPPLGAGDAFLIYCLSLNAQYWDGKIGFDETGMLSVHADLDVLPDFDRLATQVADRAETVIEIIDNDLVDWLVDHGYGSPAQRQRWEDRAEDAEADEADSEQ